METFISAHPELAEADRQMLLGWRDVVEGVFLANFVLARSV